MTRHYSPSQLRQFLRCSRQWAYRYVEGLVVPPGAALVVGSSVHVPAGEYHARGLRLGTEWSHDAAREQMGAEEAGDVAAAEFDRRAVDVPWDREDEAQGEAKDRAISMARVYVEAVAPTTGRPLSVEERVTIQPEGEPWTLVAVPDLVAEEDDTGAEIVRDLKTSGKAPNGASKGRAEVGEENRRQLTVYSYARRAVTGSTPQGAAIDYVWTNKSGAQSISASVVLCDGDEVELFEQLRAMHRAVEAGVFLRGTDGFLCTPRFCGYFDRCRPHRVSVAVGGA